MPEAPGTAEVEQWSFGQVMDALDAAPGGLGRFADVVGIPGDMWRSSVADLLGVDGARDDAIEVWRLDIRTTLLTDVDPQRRCFLVLEGRFDEYRLSIRAAVRHPGDLVGYMPLLSPLDDPWLRSGRSPCSPSPHRPRRSDGGGQTSRRAYADAMAESASRGDRGDTEILPREGSEVRTTVPSVVVPIPCQRFVHALDNDTRFARVMLRYMAEHGGDYLDDSNQYDEAFEQYFPGRSGMLTPPPYTVGKADMRILFCAKPTDPSLIEQMVPPGGIWAPGLEFYMLVCTQMRDIAPKYHPKASFDYDEVAVFVPIAMLPDPRPYFHVPFMFPDNIMAIYMGREILGLPKRRSANFCEPIDEVFDDGRTADGKEPMWRFLMRRMLPSDVRERQETLGYHLPKQVDVMDFRWRKVPPEQEVERLEALIEAICEHAMPDKLAELWAGLAGGVLNTYGRARGQGLSPLEQLKADLNKFFETTGIGLPINTTAWKRIFACHVETQGGGEQQWRRGDFEVDGVVCTPFPVRWIHDLEVIDASEFPIYTSRGFPLSDVEHLSDIGLRVSVKMDLDPGRMVLDYRNSPRQLLYGFRNRLEWGPEGGDDTF